MELRIELNDFYNDGFGWICKRCERELKTEQSGAENETSRLMSEGEAESKQPRFSNLALAKWTNITRRTLICPRCGTTEAIDKF
ncbi:MAG: hypothetical protein M3T96_03185 [Acidobacteriota bacterium]|nr:hypothetical protein [Acidobacteriota bacterium]